MSVTIEDIVAGSVVEEQSYIVVSGVDFVQGYVVAFTLHPILPSANVPITTIVDGNVRCGGQYMNTHTESFVGRTAMTT